MQFVYNIQKFVYYVGVLATGTCECDSFWKDSLCGFNQVRMTAYWIGVALDQYDMTEVIVKEVKRHAQRR